MGEVDIKNIGLATVVLYNSKNYTTQPTTQPVDIPNPRVFKVGPYAIRNTGQQQMLTNPEWSLKPVELLMTVNIAEIQPACSPFLKTSFEGWTTWLRKQVPFKSRQQRDLTGALGTGLGILNGIDSEILINKLASLGDDMTKLQQPLQSSLSALGTHQWLLSKVLPQWLETEERDHELIIDALKIAQDNISLALSCTQAQLWIQSVSASIIREGEEGTFPIEIRKIVWDKATELERELQSWWTLVNFTYDSSTNTAITFVLTIRNSSISLLYPIIALGLNHNGTVLYPSEHRAWARKINKNWQTVNLDSCITRTQLGFICESNTIDAQDICLDTEQNICHFEIHPDSRQKTLLVYTGHGCVCLRTACDSLTIEYEVVQIDNHSNLCICNFTKIVGCDFSYQAPVTSHQLIKSNYTLFHQLSPVPIGMNLSLVKQLMNHTDLTEILQDVKESGQKTLITVHHDTEKIYKVLKRIKEDTTHNWWDILFGWSPTATGILNMIRHPVIILLILVLVCLVFSIAPTTKVQVLKALAGFNRAM
ncbi:uncharacterized protein [Nyctibius grandis]|uniref:uncharacterized protein n=1 Tax=Nyctibius grandis TaxID=48427 RepID=UPI0035BBF29F